MNTWQKIAIGSLAAAAWIAACYIAYAMPALAADMAQVKLGATTVISGLGIWHLRQPGDSPATSTREGNTQ
ncbi:MAG TPA: hypothetical protein VF798_06175 [Burkholderiaceae bacterium]